MLTLGHAHGTLLAVLNLALAATAAHLGGGLARTVASWGLRAATILAVATILVVLSIILLTVLELLRRRNERLRGMSPG